MSKARKPAVRAVELPISKSFGFDDESIALLRGEPRSDGHAARLLQKLALERGVPSRGGPGGPSRLPTDSERVFEPRDGGSRYRDLDKPECATAEESRLLPLLARRRANLDLLARDAETVSEQLGHTVDVYCTNGDRSTGLSVGTHFNVSLAREAFDALLYPGTGRPASPLLEGFLVPVLCGLQVLGQGSVVSRELAHALGVPGPCFSLSSRALVMRRLTSLDTQFERAIVNTRDESLAHEPAAGWAGCEAALAPGAPAGSRGGRVARLHLISLDRLQNEYGSFLTYGLAVWSVLLVELAALGHVRLPDLSLFNPVDAIRLFALEPRLPALTRRVPMRNRVLDVGALDLLEIVGRLGRRLLAQHPRTIAGWFPDAAQVLDLLEETLAVLRSPAGLLGMTGRLDAADRYQLCLARSGAISAAGPLDWGLEQELVRCDLLYGKAGNGSLFDEYDRLGLTRRLVPETLRAEAAASPPDTTRAYFRAHVLRRFGRELDEVWWNRLRWRGWTIPMADPLGFCEATVGSELRAIRSVEELFRTFGRPDTAN